MIPIRLVRFEGLGELKEVAARALCGFAHPEEPNQSGRPASEAGLFRVALRLIALGMCRAAVSVTDSRIRQGTGADMGLANGIGANSLALNWLDYSLFFSAMLRL